MFAQIISPSSKRSEANRHEQILPELLSSLTKNLTGVLIERAIIFSIDHKFHKDFGITHIKDLV